MIPRYGPDYRKSELSKICQAAQRGDSLAFVGIAGTGKSNITNFLCNDPYGYKPQYLQDKIDVVHFALVDSTIWDGTSQGLMEIIFDAVNSIANDLPAKLERPNIIPLAQEWEHGKHQLSQLSEWVCQKLDHRIMIILDDFDNVIQTGPLSLVEELSRLRNENRGKLSYLIFTKILPHVLGREYDLENKSKFYDLFKGQIFSLGMYTYDDSQQMLSHLNFQAENKLASEELFMIQSLAGGHARLMKLLFEIWLANPPPAAQELRYFSEHPLIYQECQRVLYGLHPHEREIVRNISRNISLSSGTDVFVDYLRTRGLLVNVARIQWFSPLMSEFLRLPYVSDTKKIDYVWQRETSTRIEQNVNDTLALVEYFFSLARFKILKLDENQLPWVESDDDRWIRFGEMPVVILAPELAELEPDLNITEMFTFLQANVEVSVAFLITAQGTSHDLIHQIWTIQQQSGCTIVPIDLESMREILQYSNPNAEGKLNRLLAEWKTVADPFASISSIHNSEWFFGPQRNRDAAEILYEITHQRSSGYYAIYGMRRVGKTSLINQVQVLAEQNRHVVSITLCQRVFSADYTHEELLSTMIKDLARSIKVRVKTIDDNLPDLSNKEYVANNWRQLAEELVKAYGIYVDSRTIVILDEVDVIYPNINSPRVVYDEYVAFSQSIKELLENSDISSKIGLIVVMEHNRINTENKFQAQPEYQNPFFGRFRLGTTLLPLTKADWTDMMQTIGARAGMVFADDGLDSLFVQSGGHPEIARYVGSILVEEGLSGVNIEISDIQSALKLALDRNSMCAHYLRENFWENRLSADREVDKRVLQLVAKNDFLTLDVFKNLVQIEYLDELNRREASYFDEEFKMFFDRYLEALNRLVALSILFETSDRYSYTIPLFRKWIRSTTLGLGDDVHE